MLKSVIGGAVAAAIALVLTACAPVRMSADDLASLNGVANAHETALDPARAALARKLAGLKRPDGQDLRVLAQHEEATDPQELFEDTGTGFRHRLSGLVCEQTMEQTRLELDGITLFDDQGYDVACNYLGMAETRVLTIYATYAPRFHPEMHKEAAAEAMLARFEGATAMGVLTVPVDPDGTGSKGRMYGVGFDIGSVEGLEGAQKTGVWITRVDGWHLKVRATYAHGEAKLAEPTAALFLAETAKTVRAHQKALRKVRRALDEVS